MRYPPSSLRILLFSRLLSRRRARRRPPESNRKRKLGGNSNDHRPYFTYWITSVQVLVLLISMAVYGAGPVGVDLYKKQGMVSGGRKMKGKQKS